MAAPRARRTQGLTKAQLAVALSVGGSGGARHCVALAMHAGVDLLLAFIRTMQTPECSIPRVLGVDDWAKRKGQTYGTILIDPEQGRVVDILADRTTESLESWLKAHPGAEIVSRDRFGAAQPDLVQRMC